MKEIILVDNKDITIKAIMLGKSTLLTKDIRPNKSLDEWTPAYEKRCDCWKKIAEQKLQALK